MGWILQQHGLAARSEFGLDERFEAMVAGIVADFLHQHDPRRERCWIATLEGEPVGCVFLVRRSRTTAQLPTDDVAVAARSIYAAAGFQRVAAKPRREFGRKLVGETWELAF
jgi:hypothetical protein